MRFSLFFARWAAAIGVAVTATAQAGPPPWAAAPYSYYAQNAKLPTVLHDFASSFSLSLQLSEEVQGKVHGNLLAQSPTEFLDRLSSVYGLTWFTHAGTLYVNRTSESATRAITSGTSSIASVREALKSLGVLDARFGWGELAEQGVALVSGPPPYVDLVARTMAALPVMAGGQRVAVFRLKHASVDDRVILYRDRQITTPGLAQVLRNLIAAQTGSAGGTGVNNTALSSVALPAGAPLARAADLPPAPGTGPGTGSGIEPGMGPQSQPSGAAGSQAGTQVGTSAAAPRRMAPSIQADSRLNAIIVQDTPERIPLYQALIEQLDVPTPLIEIEAMIIDINSSRLDELGISWSGRKGGTVGGFGRMARTGDGNDLVLGAVQRGASIDPSSLVVNAGNHLISRIRALESQGEAHVQSRPSILTLDNTGALLDLSETFYIRSVGERVATVTPVTAGTTLRVTPHFVERSEGPVIQLDVDIEDGQIQETQTVDALPIVRRSTVSTQAIVGEGQTLLIGGYKNTQKLSDSQRVPGLGAVPVVGWLFSHQNTTHQSRERLFMIKPRLVGLPDQSTPSVAVDLAPAAPQAPPSPPPTAIDATAPIDDMPLTSQ